MDEGHPAPSRNRAMTWELFQRDRVFTDGSWKTEQHEITHKFEATFDLENIQRGWMNFPREQRRRSFSFRLAKILAMLPAINTKRASASSSKCRMNLAAKCASFCRPRAVCGMQLMLSTIVTLLPHRIMQENCLQSLWRT